MTRDDVIRMVREIADKTTVDPVHGDPPLIVVSPDEMIRFAKLAQAAEREACAAFADELSNFYWTAYKKGEPSTNLRANPYAEGAADCADALVAAIRARGQT